MKYKTQNKKHKRRTFRREKKMMIRKMKMMKGREKIDDLPANSAFTAFNAAFSD